MIERFFASELKSFNVFSVNGFILFPGPMGLRLPSNSLIFSSIAFCCFLASFIDNFPPNI